LDWPAPPIGIPSALFPDWPSDANVQIELGDATATVFIDGRLVMHQRLLPGFDDDDAFRQAQDQFDGLIRRYPERTLGHPPLDEIFSSSYRRARPGP